MNADYKKGFLEAIDDVLDIINDAEKELDKENKSFKYELQKLENSVLGLKVAFFETYYAEKGAGLTEEEAMEEDEKEQFDNESSREQEKNPIAD